MNSRNVKKIFFPLLIAVAGGCGYSVSVNDNVVYTPEPLFTEFMIADANLNNCVQQTIQDKKITAANQLLALNCSNAGITNTAGLEKFSALKELNLTGNKLHQITSLEKLAQLQVLLLRGNQLTDIAPLLKLLSLTILDVSENPQLKCADINQLAKNLKDTATEIIKPEQCH